MESQESNELFGRDPKGKFQVLFLNTAGLSLDDIIKIFSKFAKVDYVKVCGDKTGYRFVKFISIDEVEKAIKGLKYNPLIKLIPPNRRREKSKSGNENQSDQEHNYKGINTKNSNANAENGASFWNNNDDNSQTNNVSKTSVYVEDFPQAQPRKGSRGNLSNSSKKNSFKSSLRSQTSEEEITDMIVSNRKGTFVNDINKKKVIIDAEEVIIGNIPINYTAPYILHLLDSFEPIAVSNMNVIPESSIRYCHVYFKSIEDCLNVEKLFDQVALSGQKLIVQRPGTLMANALLN